MARARTSSSVAHRRGSDDERDALVPVEAGERRQRAALDLDDRDAQRRGVEHELLERRRRSGHTSSRRAGRPRRERLLDRAPAGDQLLVLVELEAPGRSARRALRARRTGVVAHRNRSRTRTPGRGASKPRPGRRAGRGPRSCHCRDGRSGRPPRATPGRGPCSGRRNGGRGRSAGEPRTRRESGASPGGPSGRSTSGAGRQTTRGPVVWTRRTVAAAPGPKPEPPPGPPRGAAAARTAGPRPAGSRSTGTRTARPWAAPAEGRRVEARGMRRVRTRPGRPGRPAPPADDPGGRSHLPVRRVADRAVRHALNPPGPLRRGPNGPLPCGRRPPRGPLGLSVIDRLHPSPALPVPGVLDDDAQRRELIAQPIRCGPVARRPRGLALPRAGRPRLPAARRPSCGSTPRTRSRIAARQRPRAASAVDSAASAIRRLSSRTRSNRRRERRRDVQVVVERRVEAPRERVQRPGRGRPSSGRSSRYASSAGPARRGARRRPRPRRARPR